MRSAGLGVRGAAAAGRVCGAAAVRRVCGAAVAGRVCRAAGAGRGCGAAAVGRLAGRAAVAAEPAGVPPADARPVAAQLWAVVPAVGGGWLPEARGPCPAELGVAGWGKGDDCCPASRPPLDLQYTAAGTSDSGQGRARTLPCGPSHRDVTE